jgi:hypothetical protein
MLDCPGFNFWQGQKIYLFQNILTCSVAHSASYTMGSGILPKQQSGWGIELTIFHPVPRLRMSGTLSLLSLYVERDNFTLHVCPFVVFLYFPLINKYSCHLSHLSA